MKTLLIAAMAAAIAMTSYVAVAADKKPSAQECKKNPKLKGCEKKAEKK